LDDAVFGISAACLFIFFLRNSEKNDGLQSEILRAPRFIDNFIQAKIETRPACSRSAGVFLFFR